MIKNYFVNALRNARRNKSFAIINVTGLTVAITACIVIFLLIRYELAFDTFHTRYTSIHRVTQSSLSGSGMSRHATVPYPFVPAFRHDFSDVPLVTQLHVEGESEVNINGDKFEVDGVIFADSLFFEVFDFVVLSGNPEVELGEPGKVFITQSLADKINKDQQVHTLRLANTVELEIAGIIQDPPATSHLQFSMVVSYPSLSSQFIGGLPLDQWGMSASGICYMVLPEGVTAESIEARLTDFVTKYHSPEDAKRKSYTLQPLRDIHFDTSFSDAIIDTTSIQQGDLIVLGVLAAFIIIIACINFINLSTALAVRKAKEVGIRKTLGAGRWQLTGYMVSETLLLALAAVFISLCLTEWVLPWLNAFLGKQLELELIGNYSLVLFLFSLLVFVVLFSGLYPAAVLARFNPVVVLKTNLTGHEGSGGYLRKVLVVFQFTMAQVLIIGTLIIGDQMEYFRSKPLGFDREAIITVSMPDNKKEVLESFRTRLAGNPDILNLSYSIGSPLTDNTLSTGFGLAEWSGDERHRVNMKLADRFFLDTYGLKLKAGRWFTETDEKLANLTLPADERKFVYVINESAMRQLGFQHPDEVIGKRIATGVYDIEGDVIGVVADFHTASLHNQIGPVVLMNFPFFYYSAGIKINPVNMQETIAFIERAWNETNPDRAFNYEFLDDYTASLYRHEQKVFTLFKIFAGISIFVGCLGLYGLISFIVNQKVREVGIRKVMGASVVNIVSLFSKEFVQLIILAFILAAPVAWFFMDKWLQGFAYRVTISWTVFAAGLGSTLVIAFLTVSYRSIKAALSNPVKTLRTE